MLGVFLFFVGGLLMLTAKVIPHPDYPPVEPEAIRQLLFGCVMFGGGSLLMVCRIDPIPKQPAQTTKIFPLAGLDQKQQTVSFCPRCHAKVKPIETNCKRCGASLQNSS